METENHLYIALAELQQQGTIFGGETPARLDRLPQQLRDVSGGQVVDAWVFMAQITHQFFEQPLSLFRDEIFTFVFQHSASVPRLQANPRVTFPPAAAP